MWVVAYWVRLLSLSGLGVVILCVGVLVYWTKFPYPPNTKHLRHLATDPGLYFIEEPSLVAMLPTGRQRPTGFVFYPGGVVDSRSYLYRLAPIARAGIGVFIVRPPAHLAVTDPLAFDHIRAVYPSIQHWYIGGHSLGGIVACWYAHRHPDQIDGLVLMASYCLDDISNLQLQVLSLSGGQDHLIRPQTEVRYRPNLPESAIVIELSGFQHSDFGDYETDNPSMTSLDDAKIQSVLEEQMMPFFH